MQQLDLVHAHGRHRLDLKKLIVFVKTDFPLQVAFLVVERKITHLLFEK